VKHPVYDPRWSDLVKAIYEHDMDEIWDARRAPHLFNYYHAELARYQQLAGEKSLRILDVGCAQGTLALLLAEAGHQVVAVDLRPEFLDYARTRYERGQVEFVQGNALDLKLEKSFDLIFANQIIEHLIHPVELIQGLARLLAPQGRIVSTTPNGTYLKSNYPLFSELGDLAQYEDRQFSSDGEGHFFAYSPDELRKIFLEAGLSKVQIIPYSTPWISGHMKIRFLHGRIPVAGLSLLDRLCLSLPWVRWKFGYQLMGIGSR